MEMKAVQGREKRWARRGRLLSLFGHLPLVESACPFFNDRNKRRRGTEGGGRPRKWIEKRWARRGRQVQFLTVSHWSPVPSSMLEKKKRKKKVSNSSDRGTPQRKRNCLLHCQPMAIPASSPRFRFLLLRPLLYV